ncbi:hypothetical protein [Dinoroseobacter sp. S375]|uniref:hypothetical protein n=1 Tax=Dinoroseobacter sp. S375 TaxID=3415136 RepID=UPI003C7E48B5
MNQIAPIGHNTPPDPIDEALAPYGDTISEAENWLDGEPVTDEGQMKAVDALIKTMRTANSDLGKAKKAATAPLHDAWKAEIARWKPTEDDIERIRKGLTALVAPLKQKLADEKEAARVAAQEEARRKEREAQAAIAAANVADIEEQREAAAKIQEAREAQKAASAANKDTVKGMRTVTKWEITDYSDMLRWLNKNDRPALEEFCNEYARRYHKDGTPIAGVRVWTEKEAY